jgi:hypothetical protein
VYVGIQTETAGLFFSLSKKKRFGRRIGDSVTKRFSGETIANQCERIASITETDRLCSVTHSCVANLIVAERARAAGIHISLSADPFDIGARRLVA